ncbi:hypothetical protein [Candidatus Uabimicrobium amorphum]|uniref:Uncharacterized protein n=1 Tax=Uabimicrobium amorphum TaxID=2596890 RepID=A0A5S9IWC0_UABAM|nr:hypothetical protein [Candidatus Uabimicrobium amorphum]BBM87745.1 hypothetical protein UABAM_06160 [Candidatus Uabimicrobium amorphum]
MFIRISCFLILCVSICAQNSANNNFFVERQISKAKQIAEETKDVVVVVETELKALIIFCNGNFKHVLVHARKRQVGMNFYKMDFLLLDKIEGKDVVFKNPRRFRSFLASRNDITIRKNTFKSFTNKVTSSSEFFKAFVLNNRRRSTSRQDFIDVQIFDFREKKQRKKSKRK